MKNICKLQSRYPEEKWSRDYAVNRDLNGERHAMNKAKGDDRTLLLVKLSSCNIPQETWLLAVKVLQDNDYHDEGKA